MVFLQQDAFDKVDASMPREPAERELSATRRSRPTELRAREHRESPRVLHAPHRPVQELELQRAQLPQIQALSVRNRRPRRAKPRPPQSARAEWRLARSGRPCVFEKPKTSVALTIDVLTVCHIDDVDHQRFIAHGVHDAKPALSYSELVRTGEFLASGWSRIVGKPADTIYDPAAVLLVVDRFDFFQGRRLEKEFIFSHAFSSPAQRLRKQRPALGRDLEKQRDLRRLPLEPTSLPHSLNRKWDVLCRPPSSGGHDGSPARNRSSRVWRFQSYNHDITINVMTSKRYQVKPRSSRAPKR